MKMKVLCLDLNPRKGAKYNVKRMSPPLMVTEDTPPDMLAGAMDLRLVLPNGNRVKMNVDRRTPMMDLLVQVTTAYKISPAGHVLQPYGENGLLPYKPSTPIGALDTWTVHIVPKHQALQNPANKISLKQIIQPFEQTFRFQVNLPRNQLYVTRVNGRTTMGDILEQACREKCLDISKYTLKHPKQLDGVSLCEELSIAEYGHNQVSMVSNRTLPSSVSSEDILAMHKFSNSSKSCESSSRSLSPDSSVSPRQPVQPSRPFRKRRPAPKPPTAPQTSLPKESTNINSQQKESSSSNNGPVICHSRTSSDSSGYHEASVLSESPDSNNSSSLPDSLPRRSKLPSNHVPTTCNNTGAKQKLSRSLSNLHQASTSSAAINGLLPPMKPAQSTSSLVPSRKKKPAPPPPVFSIAEEREETSSQASRSSKTLPAGTRLQQEHSEQPVAITQSSAPPTPPPKSPVELLTPVESNPNSSRHIIPATDSVDTITPRDEATIVIDSSDTSSIVTPSETDRIEAEIERMFEQATREHVSLESGVDLGESPERLPSPPSQDVNKIEIETEDDPFMDWEYKLPAPPTFRDETNSPPPLTDYSTMTVGKMKEVLYESTNNNRNTNNTISPSTNNITTDNNALISELSSAIVDRKMLLRSQSHSQFTDEDKNRSNLENFHITTYNGQGRRSLVRMYSEGGVNTRDNGGGNIIEETSPTSLITTTNKGKHLEDEEVVQQNTEELPPTEDMKKTDFIKEKQSSLTNNSNNDATLFINEHETIYRKQEENGLMKTGLINKKNCGNSFSNVDDRADEADDDDDDDEGDPKVDTRKIKERLLGSSVTRTSSFVQDKKETTQVKRSLSYVSGLSKARLNLSKSNSDLVESSEEDNNMIGGDSSEQEIRLHLRPVAKNMLRKTSSELSIIDLPENKKTFSKQESDLQSLQVLRSILPQISQSQGSMNTVGINTSSDNVTIIKEEPVTTNFVRPTISVSTWGERPKRQVSIKSDRDYVFGQKVILKPISQVVKTSVPQPIQPKPLLISLDKRIKPSVYKTLETGNTKPIRLQNHQELTGIESSSNITNLIQNNDNTSNIKLTTNSIIPSRLPVVRSVELKKPYQLRQQEQPPLLPATTTTTTINQQRPVSSYLFGCQPQISETNNKFTSIIGINQQPQINFIKLKPTTVKRTQPIVLIDPREELLRSIRTFGGRDSLRKVSTTP